MRRWFCIDEVAYSRACLLWRAGRGSTSTNLFECFDQGMFSFSFLFCYPPARNTRQHSPFSTTLHWIGHIPVLDGGSPCRLPDQSVHISTFLKMISERKKKKILKSRNNLVRLLVHVKSQTKDLLCVAACHLQRCCLMCSFAATLSELLGRKRVNIWTPHSSHGGKVWRCFFFDNQVLPQA